MEIDESDSWRPRDSRKIANSFGRDVLSGSLGFVAVEGGKKRNARRNNAVRRVKFAGEFGDAAPSKEELRDTAVIVCSFANFETKGATGVGETAAARSKGTVEANWKLSVGVVAKAVNVNRFLAAR